MTATQLPRAWKPWADEHVTSWVKANFAPDERWKGKPFGVEDARFFSKGVRELSSLFTERRPKRLPDYFSHPRFRSSYLLYFLPLHAAKFVTLLERHREALDAALAAGRKRGTLRVLDLGSGPGTGSTGLLMTLLDRHVREGLAVPPIELHWWDQSGAILKDGQALLESWLEMFPVFRGKVTIRPLVTTNWGASARQSSEPWDLVLVGHLLNEGRFSGELERALQEILARTGPGGCLMIEPAAREHAHGLSAIRAWWIEHQGKLWGPCLHAGICPLAQGRDWCHFSVRTEIPGKWFEWFSKGLGSKREWLKFSYLFLAPPQGGAARPASPSARLVVSDPLPNEVLLCEPERPQRWRFPRSHPPGRGDVIDLGKKPAPFRAPSEKSFEKTRKKPFSRKARSRSP